MTTRFPAPSRRYRVEGGPCVVWFLNGRWMKFHILQQGTTDFPPEDAELIGHVMNKNHLEELYQSGDQFFRYAGDRLRYGGRGFYWTQELELVE